MTPATASISQRALTQQGFDYSPAQRRVERVTIVGDKPC